MPEGAKPSPPQQSRLEEMWKRKKKPEHKDEEAGKASMDIDQPSMYNVTRYSTRIDAY